jgi:hypothetical protein
MKLNCVQNRTVPIAASLTAFGALVVAGCGGSNGAANSGSQQTSTIFTDTALVVDKSEVVASAAGVQANPTDQVYNGSGSFLINTSKGQVSGV